jgi:DNA-binding transcriptional regulator GbsR (MarR family)
MPKAGSKAKAVQPKSQAQEELVAFPSPGKVGQLIALLLRPGGATLAQMQEATGWQAHSVRGAMSGSIKKKLGLNIVSEKAEAGRTYRIIEKASDDAV